MGGDCFQEGPLKGFEWEGSSVFNGQSKKKTESGFKS